MLGMAVTMGLAFRGAQDGDRTGEDGLDLLLALAPDD